MKLEESGLMMRKLFLDIDGEVEGVGPAGGGGGIRWIFGQLLITLD